MKITTVLALAALVAAAMGMSGVAQAQNAGACAARCKAYCDKNYPGRAPCMERCVTRQCNK